MRSKRDLTFMCRDVFNTREGLTIKIDEFF